jgi:hypothetical protein
MLSATKWSPRKTFQRLSIDDTGAPYLCTASTQFIYFNWDGVESILVAISRESMQFSPPVERLAFTLTFAEERNFPEILPDPLPVVVTALHSYSSWDALYKHLPDWDRPSLENQG